MQYRFQRFHPQGESKGLKKRVDPRANSLLSRLEQVAMCTCS